MNVCMVTIHRHIHNITSLFHWGRQTLLLLRSLHTPFASSTFIRFLIHARRSWVLLTSPFSKTCPIWSKNVSLRLLLTALPAKIHSTNLFCQSPFIYNFQMTKPSQNHHQRPLIPLCGIGTTYFLLPLNSLLSLVISKPSQHRHLQTISKYSSQF
jgi:hypothetical protein